MNNRNQQIKDRKGKDIFSSYQIDDYMDNPFRREDLNSGGNRVRFEE